MRGKPSFPPASGVMGIIYLLHFNLPYRHARHYMGWTTDLDERIESHRKGAGAILLKNLKRAHIGFTIARTWPGDRNQERHFKEIHRRLSGLCPICKTARQEETPDHG